VVCAVVYGLTEKTSEESEVFCFSFFGSLSYLCTPTSPEKRNLHPSRQSEAACRYFIDKLKGADFSAPQTVEKGAERRKVIAKRDKKQTLPIK